MSCQKGMTGCARSCLHRQLVTEYRAAREAAELARESATGSYPSESAAYGPLLTFKAWLIATASPAREDVAA